jgi:rod shape-determining protein MreD
MTRLLLRAFNGPALILLALIGIAIQTSFFSFWILPYIQPDIVLLMVIWCALRRDFIEGGILTLIIGNVSEIHSAAPGGLFMISYMLVYLLVRFASRLFVIPDLSSFLLVTLLATVLEKITNLIVLMMLGTPESQIRHSLIYLFPVAIVNAVIGRWIYRWLEKFDWVTYKNVQADRTLEDELQLESQEI